MVDFTTPLSGSFGDTAANLSSKLFTSILYFGIAIVFIGVVLGVIYYFFVYKKKFDIKVKVISDRNKDNKEYFDIAAVLIDRKTNTKFLRLFNTKVDLPVPIYRLIRRTNEGDYIEVWRKSEDEFIFLDKPKIVKSYVMRSDGTLVKVGKIEQVQLEGDVGYWNIKRKAQNKNMFASDSILMKLLPFLPHIIVGMISIFILYVLMDALPQVLAELTKLANTLNEFNRASVATVSR